MPIRCERVRFSMIRLRFCLFRCIWQLNWKNIFCRNKKYLIELLSGIFVSAFYVYFMLPKYRHFTFSNEKIGAYYTGVRRVLTKIFGNREVLAYVTATENSEYRTKSVQEFRFELSQGIRSQIFFATFVKNIETHIKSNAMTKALKQLIHQQVYHL